MNVGLLSTNDAFPVGSDAGLAVRLLENPGDIPLGQESAEVDRDSVRERCVDDEF